MEDKEHLQRNLISFHQ